MGWGRFKRNISRPFKQIEKGVKRAVKDVADVIEDAVKDVGVIIGIGMGKEDYDKPALSSSDVDSASGALLNKTAASSSINVVVGTRRVGGTRVLLHTQGAKNADLYSVLILSEGPIHGIRDIEINDEKPAALGGSNSYTINSGARISLTPDVSLCGHFGSWSQAADAFFSSNLGGLWTSAHKLTGLAYTATRYTYNAEKISSLPNQTAVVDGALLYDPRDGQTKFSSNAALVNLFYMRNGVFGERVPDEEIDFESFKVAADIADRTAETFAGSGVTYKPVDINAVINTGKSRLDNMKALLAHSHASLPYSEGKYRLFIRSEVDASFEFNADNISGDISVSSSGASNKYNRVAVKFVDPDLNWQENTMIYPTDDAEYQQLLVEDNGIEKHADITADMVTNKYQALDYARRYLYESRKGLVISFSALPAARKVLPGQVVELNSSNLGSFLFTVTKRTITADGEYRFTLKEYDPSIYSWINQTEITSGETPTLPSVYNLPAPTNLVFTKVGYNPDYQGVLSWDESESAFVTRYRIEIYNTVTGMLAWSSQATANSIQVPNLPAGNYRADAKGLSEISATPTTSISWTYSVPVLPIVTGLQQYGEFDDTLMLTWDKVSNRAALRMYQVDLLLDDLVIYSVNTSTESVTIGLGQFEALGFPRVFNVNVSAVNVALSNGPAASLLIEKPAPLPPLSVSFTPSATSFLMRLVKATRAKGVTAWLSTDPSVPQSDENQVYSGDLARFEIGDLSPLTAHYFRIASYDAFGLGTSSAHTVTTLRDAVADSIQQLTERDLSLTEDLESVAQSLAEKAAQQSANTAKAEKQMLSAAARAAEVRRQQQSQNDEYYRILNAVVEIDPSTGTITNRAYEYTNGKFSEAALLIDGVNASINLQATRIETAEGRLSDAESQLTVQAGLINQRATYTQLTETVADAIAAIQPAYVTTFNTGLDGWSAVNGTIAYNAGAWLDAALGDVSSAMDFDGAENPVVQLTIARAAGAAWIGKIQYKTASHDYSSTHEMDINDIPDDGQQYTVSVDFGSVADYTASTITGMRIILGETTADAYQIHSVQAGKRTAAQAAIEGLQGRVSVAEQNIDAVNGKLSNYVTTAFYEQNTLTQNDVQQTLDSWNAQYSIIAKLTELDENGTITKANSAEQWIDGAEALISQIAQSTAREEFGTRITNVEQTLDAQNGTIAQQITSIYRNEAQSEKLAEDALLAAGKAAAAKREQVGQSDTIALARSETKAVAEETTALAQTVDELAVQVGDNKAEFTDYRRTAIGYCVDADGNPTSHETAESCELAGNTWRGESSIAEALRNVTVTGTNAAGEPVEVSAGNMYQAILDADGKATATAAVMAIYGGQLAGIFANAGEDGSSLEFLANQMKFKTENGTKTPFFIEGDNVYIDQGSIKELTVSKLKSEDGAIAFQNGKLKAELIDADNLEVDFANLKNVSVQSAQIANGSITSAKIANASIDSAQIVDGAITSAKIANASIDSAKINDGSITSAKIGSEIKSDNFLSGVRGWRILKNGSAEFNGVVVSRELTVASGTFGIGYVNGRNTAGIEQLGEWILDTGHPSGAWSGSRHYTVSVVGFTNTSVAVYAEYHNGHAVWGLESQVIPMTRWSGTPTVHIRIRLYGRRVDWLNPFNISWRLLKVS